MLLSIDRVLQLLAGGKSLEKISELASCDVEDVVSLIEEARSLINRHEKASGRRKVIIKKKVDESAVSQGNDAEVAREVLSGAELAAIPVDSSLTMYINGLSDPETGNAGIGIVIFDREDRQVGKVSDFIGRRSPMAAEYVALIRALKIAEYFRVSELRVRTDSEKIIRQINSAPGSKNSAPAEMLTEVLKLSARIKNFRIEHISKSQNDKAGFLAQKGSGKTR